MRGPAMSGSDWYLAHSLRNLVAEIDYRYPNRPIASDGSIGDTRHQAEFSDHNPDGKGCVHAIDITTGVDVGEQVTRLLLMRARRGQLKALYYVIFRGVIYSKTYGWKARKYTGADPHTSHVHISINRDAASEKWDGVWGVRRLVDRSQLVNDQRDDWKVVQRRLNVKLHAGISVDGTPDAKTRTAIKKVQKILGNKQTGEPGPEVLHWLGCYVLR
jgi:hypothetical protein